MLALPILAQIPVAERSELASWMLLGLVVLLATDKVIAIVRGLRRQPPLEEQFASKAALTCCEERGVKRWDALQQRVREVDEARRKDIAAVFERLEKQRGDGERRAEKIVQTVQEGFEEIHRSLGRLEGEMKAQGKGGSL